MTANKKQTISTVIEEINEINPEYKQLIALSQSQTAQIIGVSNSTLERWRRESLGPEFKKIDIRKGRVLYPKTAIAEWLLNTVKTA